MLPEVEHKNWIGCFSPNWFAWSRWKLEFKIITVMGKKRHMAAEYDVPQTKIFPLQNYHS